MTPEPTNLQKAVEFKLDLDDGKYTYIRYKEGGQEALRCGEKWRQLSGDNLIYYMGCHIEELAKQLEALQRENEIMKMSLALWNSIFQRYESFRANGITTVSIDEMVSDYRKCRRNSPSTSTADKEKNL